MKNVKHIFQTGGLFFAMGAIVAGFGVNNFAPAAQAAAPTCNPAIAQGLVLDINAADTTVQSATLAHPASGFIFSANNSNNSTPTGANGQATLDTDQSADTFFLYDFPNQNPPRPVNPGTAAGAFAFAGSPLTAADKIVIKYNNAGKFNGQPIDIIATYTNFTPQASAGVNAIQIQKRNFIGVVYQGLNQFDVTYNIVSAGTTTPVAISNNAIITVASLNPGEYAAPGPNMAPMGSSGITAGTYVENRATTTTGIAAYVGNDASSVNTWLDSLGADNFYKASVSLPVTANNFTLTIGSENGSAWNTIITGVVPPAPCPETPTKTVDKTSVDVGSNRALTYTITQPTQAIPTQILTNYDDFAITDKVDPRVVVDPSKVTVKYNNADKTGNFTVTFANGLLSVTAKPAALADANFYGTNVVIAVPATVNANSLDNLDNIATAVINGNPQVSAKVSTAVNAPTLKITKSVSKTNLKIGDSAQYTFTVQNTSQIATVGDVVVTDKVPAQFTFNKTDLPAYCSADGQTLTCIHKDSIPAGGAIKFTLPVVANAVGTDIVNTVDVVNALSNCAAAGTCRADAEAVVITEADKPVVTPPPAAITPNEPNSGFAAWIGNNPIAIFGLGLAAAFAIWTFARKPAAAKTPRK